MRRTSRKSSTTYYVSYIFGSESYLGWKRKVIEFIWGGSFFSIVRYRRSSISIEVNVSEILLPMYDVNTFKEINMWSCVLDGKIKLMLPTEERHCIMNTPWQEYEKMFRFNFRVEIAFNSELLFILLTRNTSKRIVFTLYNTNVTQFVTPCRREGGGTSKGPPTKR